MFKAVDKWLPGYLQSILARPRPARGGMRHLMVSVCDHYEPFRGGTDVATARQTVNDWLSAYPASVDGFRDADGRPPRHSFFYPQEEYDEAILDRLAAFCRKGYGEVEIHLHHRHDTPEGLRGKLEMFRDLLHNRHGLLGRERVSGYQHAAASLSVTGNETNNQQPITDNCANGAVRYAFIHGNWSLCNSRPDGDWCGVNEELGILADTGCYADFTFPSAPSPTQPRMVNAIYYARDTGKPRAADKGRRLSVIGYRLLGKEPNNQEPITNNGAEGALMLITGPLALNWRRRKWGLLPRFENADLCGSNPPAADRVRLWVDQQIGVAGRPDWVFVKLHTHGCLPQNARVLLGDAMRRMHAVLQADYNDGKSWQLHYVTAREMFNLVKAAEANLPGPPGQYRDTPILWKT